MRMMDIAVLIICIELSIGFISSIGLFDHNYYQQSQQSGSTGFMTGNMSATEGLVGSSQTSATDYFTMSIGFLITAFTMLFSIVGSIVFFLPHLVSIFGVPIQLAVIIQAMVYIVYAWGIIQFMSGRSGGMLQ